VWPLILSLPPEATLCDVIRDDDGVLRDIDTPEDYQKINR
jgi:CTP:molybdopterin cytidylyltransferase MocA